VPEVSKPAERERSRTAFSTQRGVDLEAGLLSASSRSRIVCECYEPQGISLWTLWKDGCRARV